MGFHFRKSCIWYVSHIFGPYMRIVTRKWETNREMCTQKRKWHVTLVTLIVIIILFSGSYFNWKNSQKRFLNVIVLTAVVVAAAFCSSLLDILSTLKGKQFMIDERSYTERRRRRVFVATIYLYQFIYICNILIQKHTYFSRTKSINLLRKKLHFY